MIRKFIHESNYSGMKISFGLPHGVWLDGRSSYSSIQKQR